MIPTPDPQPIPASTNQALLMWLLRRRRRLRVTGDSMLPHLSPGQEVLVLPSRLDPRSPQIGDVVVLSHPFQAKTTIVKRIVRVLPDGRYVLLGDNPEASTDSRTFGPVPVEQIQGRIICRFP